MMHMRRSQQIRDGQAAGGAARKAKEAVRTPQNCIYSALLSPDQSAQHNDAPGAKNDFVSKVNASDHMFDPLELKKIALEMQVKPAVYSRWVCEGCS